MSSAASPSMEYFAAANRRVFGHRGMGVSFNAILKAPAAQPLNPKYIENTIESVNAVATGNGDGVEFDVVLTKDRIPVIFHDFYVAVRTTDDYQVRPVHGLTLDEIKSLPLYHQAVLKAKKDRPDLSADLFKLTYPKMLMPLSDWFKQADSRLAFNLEVKYPQDQAKSGSECAGYHSREVVAERVIADMIAHAGSRPIVISSFDLDTCLEFANRQETWPVATLTQGLTAKYEAFADPRQASTQTVADFAKNMSLWGISGHAEDFVKDRSLLTYVRRTSNLSLMIWGSDVADPVTAVSLLQGNADNANIIITDSPIETVAERDKVPANK